MHEGGFAAAAEHKLGPKLLEARAEAHGKPNHGFQHVQNVSNKFKHVSSLLVLVLNFRILWKVDESGHNAGNIGTTECPSEIALPCHITPPLRMQNFGTAISLRQLQHTHVHERFGNEYFRTLIS